SNCSIESCHDDNEKDHLDTVDHMKTTMTGSVTFCSRGVNTHPVIDCSASSPMETHRGRHPSSVSNGSGVGHRYRRMDNELDSGFWAWIVVLGSFLTNGIIFSIINSYGILFETIQQHFKSN